MVPDTKCILREQALIHVGDKICICKSFPTCEETQAEGERWRETEGDRGGQTWTEGGRERMNSPNWNAWGVGGGEGHRGLCPFPST